MKVDLIGIGVQKAGTTMLAHLLDEHPGICMSVPKEVRFFNRQQPRWSHHEPDHGYRRGLDWYFRHFSHCGDDCIRGEYSNLYFIDEAAPARIQAAFPDVRLIVSLRDPIRRAWSAYQMHRQYGHYESRSFADAVREEPDYVERGLYHKHLQRYLALFDPEQIHVLLLEDFQEDPASVVRALYEFVGADPSFVPPSLGRPFNPAQSLRFAWLQRLEVRLVGALSRAGMLGLVDGMKHLGVHELVGRINSRASESQELPAAAAEWLRPKFAGDVAALEQLLGRDLDCWTTLRGTGS